MIIKENKSCLNCGEISDGKFCPKCGQSLSTGRFSMRSFGLHLLSSVSRVSGDFLLTAWGLLLHPWAVVRNYVYGKRVGLVSPITMLLLLSLYWGILMAIIPHFNQSEELETLKLGAFLKWLYGSITFQYLFLAIPIALGTWAVYRTDMRGRFNFAELLIAVIYLASTFLLVDFVISPIELISKWLSYCMLIAATGCYGIISILKAFPQPNMKKTLTKLTLWIGVCGFFLFIFLMLYSLPMLKNAL